MRAILQRVSEASVTIGGVVKSRIGVGFLILLGIETADDSEDVTWLAGKVSRMRVFSDEAGLMNLSLEERRGEVLVISQFTLHASTKKGNRPSFLRAARPETAIPLYESFLSQMRELLGAERVGAGEFGADMKVALLNDGPVTIFIDSKNRE